MFKIPLFDLSSVFYTSCTKKEPYIFIGKTHKFKNCLNLMTLVLTLPDFLAEEMQDYISRLPYLKVDDRIFTITKSGLHHEMDRGCRETGVKRIRVHDLRHSHVSMLIEMGFSAVDIPNRVGHESVKVTYRYAHMFRNKDLMIAKKLNISRNGEKDEQEEPGSKWET